MRLIAAHYCRLRENDVTGASKSSYRITVRQLESMIRLSEALARLHLKEEILPQYINEAARLIKTSIVKVQSEELSLDDLEEEVQPATTNEDEERTEMQTAESTEQQSTEAPAEEEPKAPKLRITREQYQKVANL